MSTFNLAHYRWKKRLLLLFSPSIDDEAYLKQMEDIKGMIAKIKDRDLIIFQLFKNGDGYYDNEIIPFEECRRIYQDLQVNEEKFSILLIGKDGSVKMNEQHYVKTENIFYIIDQMPMRQREMRKKRDNSLDIWV